MKTRTRLSALLLALCLIVSMMIPAVSADAVVAEKTVEYSFNYHASVTLPSLDSNYNAKLSNANNLNTLNSAYGSSIINSTYFDASVTPSVRTTKPDVYCATKLNGWIAYKFKAPGNGDFSIFVLPYRDGSNAEGCNVYVFPVENVTTVKSVEDNLTSDNLTKADLNLYTKDSLNAGTYSFISNKEYIIAFKATKDKDGNNSTTNVNACINLKGFSMTQAVSASTAADAISNAPLGTTVKLSAAYGAITESIVVGNGVTLDLHGNDLTANLVNIVNGGSVIDTGATAGLVTANLSASGSNGGYLPLKDNTGYRFFSTTVTKLDTTKQDGDAVKYYFRLQFDNTSAYDLIASGNTGIVIGADLNWAESENHYAKADPVQCADFYSGWANAAKVNTNIAISLKVKGTDQVTNFTLTPNVQANGVTLGSAN